MEFPFPFPNDSGAYQLEISDDETDVVSASADVTFTGSLAISRWTRYATVLLILLVSGITLRHRRRSDYGAKMDAQDDRQGRPGTA